jgi:rhodanese-related sulfurtransferase
MRRFLRIFLVILLVFLIVGCDEDDPKQRVEILPEDLITMEVLDDYMFRDDVQYVDLRNFSSRFLSGYIDSFEIIPFFDYLDYRVFDREDIFEFDADHILDSNELERLFDRDKAIFLYADGCIRSGYLKDVLNHLGYERVYVLGGYYEYQGEYKVLGTGDYVYGNTFYSSYTNLTSGYTYFMYGNHDLGKKITFIRFDITDGDGKTIRGEFYNDDFDYNSQLTILENFIISDIVTMNELYSEVSNLDDSVYSSIPNFTFGIDNDLISLIETLNIN